ncbi:hypothetical protein PRIPAC_88755, partial [Pristionchus pacificus]
CSNRQDLQQLSSKTCHSIEMDKTKHDPEFVPPGDDDWPSQVFRDQIISCLETEIEANVHDDANAREVEQRIFVKCQSKDEYMSSITTVINAMKYTSKSSDAGPSTSGTFQGSSFLTPLREYGPDEGNEFQKREKRFRITPKRRSNAGIGPRSARWSPHSPVPMEYASQTPSANTTHMPRPGSLSLQAPWAGPVEDSGGRPETSPWLSDQSTPYNILDAATGMTPRRDSLHDYFLPPQGPIRKAAMQQQALLVGNSSQSLASRWPGGDHPTAANPSLEGEATSHSALPDDEVKKQLMQRHLQDYYLQDYSGTPGTSTSGSHPIHGGGQMGYDLPPSYMPPQQQQQSPMQFNYMDRSSVYESMKMPSDDESVPKAKRDPEGKWIEEDFESETDGSSGAARKSAEESSESETEIETIRQQIIDITKDKATSRNRNRSRQRKLYALPSATKSTFVSKFEEDFAAKRILGVGKVGCVFSAESILDCSEYAVKRITVYSSEVVFEKVLREVRAISQLDHPAIVRCHGTWMEKPPRGWQKPNDDDIDPSFIYQQMQLCNYSLQTWLSENSTQSLRPLNTIKLWFIQIVSAIGYLHGKSLVHRNLKPSNILFVKEDRIKVSDIGIVTEFSKENYDSQRPELYRSPEHGNIVRPWECTSKTDIFALGLIFAECCVVMTDEEREIEFNKYRNRVWSNLLSAIPEEELFVLSLSNAVASNRPTCKKILQNKLLTSFEQDLVYISKFRDLMGELQLPCNATFIFPALPSTSIHQKSRIQEKNNVSSARSRTKKEHKKEHQKDMKAWAGQLEKWNNELKNDVNFLEQEVSYYKELMIEVNKSKSTSK